MIAKDKAQELIEKFINLNSVKLSDYSRIEFPTAKQCALIAVEEILSSFNNIDPGKKYWEQVKQEIEKL